MAAWGRAIGAAFVLLVLYGLLLVGILILGDG